MSVGISTLQEDRSLRGYLNIWFRMATYHNIIWKYSAADNAREVCLAKVETAKSSS